MTILIRIIQQLKGTLNYEFETKLKKSELVFILFERGLQLIRGLTIKPLLKNKGFLFLGRKVHLSHKKNIQLGKSCIIGNYVTINGLSTSGIKIGNNVTISDFSFLICSGVIRNKGVGIRIGNNVGINIRAFISCQGGIIIDDDVIIGPDVRIIAENHKFDKLDCLIRLQGESRKGIKINKNCWIGANSTILDGVELGEGCVVAAGAVVTKSFPNNSIIGGVPAKLLKSR